MIRTEEEKLISLYGMFGEEFLGSRAKGEIVREMIEKEILKKGRKVVLDFAGIKGITQSFGDEILGIFARAFGKEWIKQNIRVVNLDENVRHILNLSIKLSLWYSQNMSSSPSSSSNVNFSQKLKP